MSRHCASCIHWPASDGEVIPLVRHGHELRRCEFFSPNRVGAWPHRKSHLAEVVAVLVSTDGRPGDLMTSAAFGCVEWTEASPSV